jgi:hypothetical protein
VTRRGLLIGLMTCVCWLVASTTAGALIYTPGSVTFGPESPGTVSSSQPVAVGGGGCGVDYYDPATGSMMPGYCVSEQTDIAVSGPFVITANTCPTDLYPKYHAPGFNVGSYGCSVSVAFAPTQLGVATGFLRLASSSLNPDWSSRPGILGVPLSGTGELPAMSPRRKCKHKRHRAAAAKKCKRKR